MHKHRSTHLRVTKVTENRNFETGTALENLRAEVVDIEALARAVEAAADALPAPATYRQRVVFGRGPGARHEGVATGERLAALRERAGHRARSADGGTPEGGRALRTSRPSAPCTGDRATAGQAGQAGQAGRAKAEQSRGGRLGRRVTAVQLGARTHRLTERRRVCRASRCLHPSASPSGPKKSRIREGALVQALGCERGARVSLVGLYAPVTSRPTLSRGLAVLSSWYARGQRQPRSRINQRCRSQVAPKVQARDPPLALQRSRRAWTPSQCREDQPLERHRRTRTARCAGPAPTSAWTRSSCRPRSAPVPAEASQYGGNLLGASPYRPCDHCDRQFTRRLRVGSRAGLESEFGSDLHGFDGHAIIP
jgi:hypothetical protein